jgi:hypothetical protein
MRKEGTTMEEALRNLPVEEKLVEATPEEAPGQAQSEELTPKDETANEVEAEEEQAEI